MAKNFQLAVMYEGQDDLRLNNARPMRTFSQKAGQVCEMAREQFLPHNCGCSALHGKRL